MRISTQKRIEMLLLLTSVGSTMLVMQKLWRQTQCDPLCKVMKENQYEPRWYSSNSTANNASLLCVGNIGHRDRNETSSVFDHQTAAGRGSLSIPAADAAAAASTVPSPTPPPISPFVKDQPKLIVILTYQRCGSTFFGSLFNRNPEAFYMFEPLDSLYSSMFGTKLGWNVPSDISNYRNGTIRVLPAAELGKVSDFLRSILTCQVGSLPVETLVHPFIHDYFAKEFSINRNYVHCIKRLKRKIDKCMTFLPWSHCGGRFGEQSEDRMSECTQLLTNEQFRRQHGHPKIFDDYLMCRKHLRVLVDQKCSQMLTSTCQSRQLRVIKLVRATMESMEPLLRAFPNFRVIHLVRDPRAVTLSRHRFDSSARGIYSESDSSEMLTKEAILYCRSVVRDVRVRQRLERQYPGKIYSIIYDDMVKDLKGYSEKVYRFLAAKIPYTWVRQITSELNKKNAMATASKWQKALSDKLNKEIVAVCSEFFRVVKYDWPKMT